MFIAGSFTAVYTHQNFAGTLVSRQPPLRAIKWVAYREMRASNTEHISCFLIPLRYVYNRS